MNIKLAECNTKLRGNQNAQPVRSTTSGLDAQGSEDLARIAMELEDFKKIAAEKVQILEREVSIFKAQVETELVSKDLLAESLTDRVTRDEMVSMLPD